LRSVGVTVTEVVTRCPIPLRAEEERLTVAATILPTDTRKFGVRVKLVVMIFAALLLTEIVSVIAVAVIVFANPFRIAGVTVTEARQS
jgi:hypothetical protein